MEGNERLNNLEQGNVTTDESLSSAVVVFCGMEINVTSHDEEHNLPDSLSAAEVSDREKCLC